MLERMFGAYVKGGRDTEGEPYGEEEVADVVRDVDRQTHMCEMESVAQANERQRDDVMSDQLFEVFPRLLQLQHQNDGLLRPVAGLEQIVCFVHPFQCFVWVSLQHASRIEIPDWRPTHDVQPKRSEDGKVHGRVDLLHEPGLFPPPSDPTGNCHGTDKALHEKLAGEGEDDSIKGHEGEIMTSLAVLYWVRGRRESLSR